MDNSKNWYERIFEEYRLTPFDKCDKHTTLIALVTHDRNFYEEAIKLFRGSRWHRATTTGGAITGSLLPRLQREAENYTPSPKGWRTCVAVIDHATAAFQTFIKS